MVLRGMDGNGDWTRVKVCASDCPRITKEFLAEELKKLGAMQIFPKNTNWNSATTKRPSFRLPSFRRPSPRRFSRCGTERGISRDLRHQICARRGLGPKSTDPTAICVLEHRKTWHAHWSGRDTPLIEERLDVRHLARLPLGLSYPTVVNAVGALLARPPLANGDCELVIDETGVGRAVADLFDVAGLNPTRVTITAGADQSCHGLQSWHVSKQFLISTLDARLHTGELKFAADLHEAPALRHELLDFRRRVSTAGRFSFQARVGKHDDLVLACALALWAIVGRPEPQTVEFGYYRTAR